MSNLRLQHKTLGAKAEIDQGQKTQPSTNFQNFAGNKKKKKKPMSNNVSS